jgi:hypothetical protein
MNRPPAVVSRRPDGGGNPEDDFALAEIMRNIKEIDVHQRFLPGLQSNAATATAETDVSG